MFFVVYAMDYEKLQVMRSPRLRNTGRGRRNLGVDTYADEIQIH